MAKKVQKNEPIADSLTCWNFANWPQHVFPHDPESGRHLCREHRDQLLIAGAMVRINRELVIIGLPYLKWLAKHVSGVKGLEMACNAPEHATKRGGKAKAEA